MKGRVCQPGAWRTRTQDCDSKAKEKERKKAKERAKARRINTNGCDLCAATRVILAVNYSRGSALLPAGGEVIPDQAVAGLAQRCTGWQGAARAVTAGESGALRDRVVVPALSPFLLLFMSLRTERLHTTATHTLNNLYSLPVSSLPLGPVPRLTLASF